LRPERRFRSVREPEPIPHAARGVWSADDDWAAARRGCCRPGDRVRGRRCARRCNAGSRSPRRDVARSRR